MVGDKKIIGICLTRVQSIAATEYLSCLHQYASARGWKLMVFNSPVDFYRRDSNDFGAATVYGLMNFDVLDAVVVYSDCFNNQEIHDGIIREARAHGVPVILLNRQAEGCSSILSVYDEAFKALMTHVIRQHGVTDTFFIAGRRDRNLDTESVHRIQCYKEVLAENGLPFSEDLVDYGEYWDVPAIQALERQIEKRGAPPRAIFCANDYMAIAVCDALAKKGYRIPGDVIVTGFDGVPEAEYRIPQLSTCMIVYDSLARQTLDLAERLLESGAAPEIVESQYTARLTESCGCPCRNLELRQEVQRQYALTHDFQAHDEFVDGWLSRALGARDITDLTELVPTILMAMGYVCLNEDLTARVDGEMSEYANTPYAERMDIIESRFSEDADRLACRQFSRAELIPDLAGWASDSRDTVCVLNAIHSGSEVYGYYAAQSGEISIESQRINRIVNALNIAFNSVMSYHRQHVMLLGLKKAALTDHLTGLPNLKGTTQWFEEFAADPEHHEHPMTISVYGLPKYRYIYENFGIQEIEESVRFVAEALRRANREDAFIGHVTDDEFLVINYYESWHTIADTIGEATSKFYDAMTKFNADSRKDYFLEVNAGCADLHPGWQGSLETFSKVASNAMYLNRLHYSTDSSVIKTKLPADIYKSFDLLIEKNMFAYHFQPIVDAHTGEILAYEALMRPHASIGLNPGEVMQAAVEYDRLDDIERATMFNVMRLFSEQPLRFRGRRIFLNSIPGHFLHGGDYDRFLAEFEGYLDNIVVEITEGSSVSDDELSLIRGINNGTLPIAIDDYGSGHSNIVNLLRYSPQIIKIDRFLISGIHEDTNKQLFFRSTVEFAGLNGIKVLAEGVETAEELKCVIELGADLIQGYYTGRPAPEPIDEISAEIKADMIRMSSRNSA